jgi:hypothetical protein
MREEGVRGDKIMLGRGRLHRLALALVGLIFVQLDLTCKGFSPTFFFFFSIFYFQEILEGVGRKKRGYICAKVV